MFDPGPCVYMEKLACGAEIEEEIDLRAPIEETLELIARAKHSRVRDLMVVILDRPRHEEMVGRIRAAGARIRFIPHGDVAGAMMAASPDTGIDLLWGIGGTPEGVLAAAAFKCLGGQFLGRLWPRNDEERAGGDRRRLRHRAGAERRRPGQGRQRLLRRHRCHRRRPAARSPLLQAGGARTQSLVMRSQFGHGAHAAGDPPMEKLAALAGERYD